MSVFSKDTASLLMWKIPSLYQDSVLFNSVQMRRNHACIPFKEHMNGRQRSELLDGVSLAVKGFAESRFYASPEFDRTDISLLEERECIPQGDVPDAYAYISHEDISLSVNGYSHISISSVSGDDLHHQLEKCRSVDRVLNRDIPYAFSETYGYLFADPRQCGTGVDISSVMHIPSIATLKCFPEIKKICDDAGLILSPYPDGFDLDVPHFCKISSVNDRSRSEEDSASRLAASQAVIAELERDAREEYYREFKPHVDDAVWRSFGILSNARMIGYRESFEYLSHVRLGIILSIIKGVALPQINELFFRIRRAHVILETGGTATQLDTDQARAAMLRSFFSGVTRVQSD